MNEGIGLIALGILAGGGIIVIDALVIRHIRRLGPPAERLSDEAGERAHEGTAQTP